MAICNRLNASFNHQAIDNKFDFAEYDGFAESKTKALWNFDYSEADKVVKFLNFKEKEETELVNKCENIKVVITGKLIYFKNRNEFKDIIEKNGGKVIDSISKNTTYLINNDINSTSSKNQAAKKLGIPILSEKDFIDKFKII